MAQFDVYKNVAPSKSRVPFLLDVQTDLLHTLATRVVIPLVKPVELDHKMIQDLHLEVTVQGHRLIAVGSELAAIPRKALGARVGSLIAKRTEIVRAIDIIVSGV